MDGQVLLNEIVLLTDVGVLLVVMVLFVMNLDLLFEGTLGILCSVTVLSMFRVCGRT